MVLHGHRGPIRLFLLLELLVLTHRRACPELHSRAVFWMPRCTSTGDLLLGRAVCWKSNGIGVVYVGAVVG